MARQVFDSASPTRAIRLCPDPILLITFLSTTEWSYITLLSIVQETIISHNLPQIRGHIHVVMEQSYNELKNWGRGYYESPPLWAGTQETINPTLNICCFKGHIYCHILTLPQMKFQFHNRSYWVLVKFSIILRCMVKIWQSVQSDIQDTVL